MKTKEAGTCPKCGSSDVYCDYPDKDVGSSDEESIGMECQECSYSYTAHYKFCISEGEDE